MDPFELLTQYLAHRDAMPPPVEGDAVLPAPPPEPPEAEVPTDAPREDLDEPAEQQRKIA